MDEAMEQQSIEGSVDAIIYENKDNGYTILRLSAGENGTIVVGTIPDVAPGERLVVWGKWKQHPTYGAQFVAEEVERTMPKGTEAMVAFLSSGAVKGIGAVTARKIVELFGEETFAVLEERPEELTKIKGLTRKRALAMGESFRLQMGMRRLLEFLGEHGVALTLAMPLYRHYGERALQVVQHNPYLLVQGDLGVSFETADQLALAVGLGEESQGRLEAGILYTLTYNLGNGHTFLPRRKLIPATAQLLHVGEDALERTMDELITSGQVVEEEIAGEIACYLEELHQAESYVTHRILEMCHETLLPPAQLEEHLSRIQEQHGLSYAPHQMEAVRLAAQRQVMLLTGGPGTGKTTCLRGVLALFDSLGLDTALAAPTGRAAKRLGELCGVEGTTIHRLLETQFDPASNQLVFAHDEYSPLKVDAVIVDETSMVDLSLMRALLEALGSGCRLVLVGDPDQLPSVGAGNLFSDLIRSEVVPTVRLTEIFRQAAESAIVTHAHMVNRGELPPLQNANGNSDFFFLRRQDQQRGVETIVELIEERLPKKMGIPSDQIQVLSPTRKGAIGTVALNKAIQQAVNPSHKDKGERNYGDTILRQGDRVMQIRNNYDIMWTEEGGRVGGMGVFNGDIGRIHKVDNQEGVITVDFEGKWVDYTTDMLSELELAYAITVHKAQGSEYRAVLLVAMDGPPMLLTRGVLYTAITRARELLIVVGEEQVVARMTENNRQRRRYSGLRYRLVQGGQ